MKVNFDKLISDWNKKHPEKELTKAKLAREFVAEGLHDSENSALNMMRFSSKGTAKTFTWAVLEFLAKRLEIKASEVIEWDN